MEMCVWSSTRVIEERSELLAEGVNDLDVTLV